MKKVTFFLIALLVFCWQSDAQSIVIGTGTSTTTSTGADPIHGYYNAFRYQAVYTAAELSASLTPNDEITALGWSIAGDYGGGALLGYTIKMGHTTATNSAAHDASPTTVVKNAFDYNPTVTTAGVFDMIAFDTNFVWNGVDNVLVEVCSDGSNPFTSPYGQVRTTTQTSGSRHYRVDGGTACANNTTTTNGNRPNVQFNYIDGIPPACLNVTGVNVDSFTDTEVTVSWTPSGSAETDWEIIVQEVAVANPGPGDSGTAINATTDSAPPYTVGSLLPLTDYEVFVRSYCGGSDYGAWVGPQNFTTTPTPTTVDCAAAPINTTYCYGDSDTTSFIYQSTDGSPLRVTFNAGGIESCCDDLVIFDSDGTTELFRGGNGGDLSGLVFSSSGDTITVAVDSDGSVSCAASSTCCTAQWDWNVECLTCVPSVIASNTVIEDCGNGLYDLEITFTDLGDALVIVGTTPLADNVTFPFEPVVPGTLTYTFSGYAKGTPAEYAVSHTSPVCDYNQGPFQDACPLDNDTCAGALTALVGAFGSCETLAYDTTLATNSGTIGSCELSSPATTEQDVWYEFTTNAVAGINIEVTSGTPGNVELAIYDACGGTEVICDSGLATGINSYYGLAPSTTYYLQLWNETFNDGPYELCISDIECLPATLDTATVTNLCGTSQYEVAVVLSDVADATGVSDGTTTYPFSGTTAVAGPFATGTPVNLTVVHGATTSCNIDLGSFIDTCPVEVDCSLGTPVNETYCYGNDDTTQFGYQSSDASQLRVTFNAGGIENCCDELVILDSDGTTELYRGANGGDLAGLVFTSSGDTIYVAVDSDGSVSCASGSTCCTATWDWDVECLPCTPANITSSTIVNDCGPGGTDTFRVDIVVADSGNATQITDGTNVIDITGGAGTYSTIDYAIGTSVTLDVDHTDIFCDFSLGNFGLAICPPENDECADAIALTVNADDSCTATTSGTIEGATASGESDTVCFGTEDDDVWFTFTATSTSHTIDLLNAAGSTTDLYHSLWEGTCGSLTNLLCSDPNSSLATGLTIGVQYTLRVYTWTATAGQTTTFDVCIGTPPAPPVNDECDDAIALTVNSDFNCGTVTAGTIVSSTASPQADDVTGTPNTDVWYTFVATNDEHRVSLLNVVFVNISSDMGIGVYNGTGGCGALVFEDDSDPNTLNLTGLTIGDLYYVRVYGWGTNPAQGTNFDICIGTPPPPPVNDTCATAVAASIGAFGSCATTSFDNSSASYSGVIGSCEGFAGSNEQDVWYTIATDAVSTAINIEVTSGTPGSLEIALYDACGGTEIYCDSGLAAGLNTIAGLTPSTTYFLQVWTETGSSGAYDLCLSYPPLCTPADISSSTVVDNCGAGTFTVDVVVNDAGDAGSVISDGTNTYPVVTGTVNTGTYTVGDIVTLEVIALDTNCNVALGNFTTGCPPANDDFANAISIACGDTVFGDTSAATLDENDAPDGPGSADTDSPNIWYSFLGTGQTVDLDTCLDGTDYDTEIMIYTGTSGNLTWVAEGYDECDGTNSDFLAQASFLSEAGVQYWISVEGWNVGNTGLFEMTVTCTGDESFVYYDGTWVPSDPTGTTVPGDIVVATGNAVMTGDTDCNTFTVRPGGGVTVPSGASVTTAAGMLMESSSTSYSSLILDGTVNGTMSYERHVNVNGSGTTGSNDLVSAPLTGQAFSAVASANPNIFNNGSLFLFGPYDKALGQFVTWAGTESSTLDPGVGYRAATSDNGSVTFTGTAQNGAIATPVVNGGPVQQEWNLVGNPYPSYMDSFNFVQTNLSTFDPTTAGIWGYDGSAINGWTLVNLANAALNPLVTPGQGFFVSAAANGNIQFDPSWRTVGTSDDYIVGRNAELVYMKLKLTSNGNAYGTDFFFNPNASLGFDLGYDAGHYGDTLPAFSIYSSLVENNTGDKLTLQTLNSIDVSDVTIPLGVNAVAGEELRFSIAESTLPANVQVFLDDTVANTTTLLNDSDYVITPASDLSGTGRFFLRTSEDALSTIENGLDYLDIYTLKASDELVVNGQLLANNTMLNLYDIAGRLVLSTKLDSALLQNRIDVSSINSGVYIVTVQNDSQEKTKKVIID
ncbi:T9SS type A sorting domain-containing protein [Psychroserpens mesophilus]|uniref:T9SS type A sorting domain-containing protein n=1 Tax=Psychroserpens mesophilus TaxID=325473 RepID=UPI003F499C8A